MSQRSASGRWRFRGPGRSRRLPHALAWHRRTIAALLAAGSVAVALLAARPAPAPTLDVLVASRDLGGGTVLSAGDVRRAEAPPVLVPRGAIRPGTDLAGRVVAGPVRSGEPITDVRLVGPGLLAAYEQDGLVASPVRLSDPDTVDLLRPGDLVDVLAAPRTTEGLPTEADRVAYTVAPKVRVVTVPRGRGDSGLGETVSEPGALVVLATTPAVAASLARAGADSHLSVVLRAE